MIPFFALWCQLKSSFSKFWKVFEAIIPYESHSFFRSFVRPSVYWFKRLWAMYYVVCTMHYGLCTLDKAWHLVRHIVGFNWTVCVWKVKSVPDKLLDSFLPHRLTLEKGSLMWGWIEKWFEGWVNHWMVRWVKWCTFWWMTCWMVLQNVFLSKVI